MAQHLERLARARVDDALKALATYGPLATPPEKSGPEFSLMRALGALIADPLSPRRAAPLEVEQSDEIAKRVGRPPSPGCLFVPVDLQQRDLAVASSGGGFLTQTQNAPGNEFVSALRAASVGLALGVREIPVQGGTATFPKNIADATTYWLTSETNAIAESQPTLAQIPVTPKTVGVYVELGRLVLRQISPAADAYLMGELGKAVAAGVDKALVDGIGGAQPTGIVRTSGVNTASGATLTWDKVVDAIGDVETDNALINDSAAGWAIAPDAAKIMRKREKTTGSGQFILSAGQIDGRRGFVSGSVPSGVALFGDWSQVLLCSFGILEIGVNTADSGSVLFRTGAAGIRILWSVDVAVLHGDSFCSLTSIS